MSADYIYKKKDGTTISCYGKAKEVLDGNLGMIIKFDYSGNWGLLDVTQSKKLKETDPNSYYMVWEGKDFKSKQEAEEYRNNYKGDSKLVIKNMENWEGAEIFGEEIAWDGLTEEEFESEYEKTCTDKSRPQTWKQICIHIEDWELRQKVRPLVTELEGC